MRIAGIAVVGCTKKDEREKERETKKITREMGTEKFYGKKRMRKSRLDEEERGAEEG